MINIIDSFLEESEFKYFNNYLNNSSFFKYDFTSKGVESSEKTIGERHTFNLNSEIGNLFVNKCIEKFKYKITKELICAVDKKKLNFIKPHIDASVVNLYFQIEGDSKLDNGIGFYNDNKLNIKIGFKENRAVLFDAKLLHSPLLNIDTTRTTLTIFIKEGYFL